MRLSGRAALVRRRKARTTSRVVARPGDYRTHAQDGGTGLNSWILSSVNLLGGAFVAFPRDQINWRTRCIVGDTLSQATRLSAPFDPIPRRPVHPHPQ